MRNFVVERASYRAHGADASNTCTARANAPPSAASSDTAAPIPLS